MYLEHKLRLITLLGYSYVCTAKNTWILVYYSTVIPSAQIVLKFATT